VSDETYALQIYNLEPTVSNYIMHLVYQCKFMVDSDMYVTICYGIWEMERIYETSHPIKRNFVEMCCLAPRSEVRFSSEHCLAADVVAARVASVSLEFLKSVLAAADRWEMIAAVLVEMFFYIVRNSDHGFHTTQLIAGGELLTHAKMVVFLQFSYSICSNGEVFLLFSGEV
jgi:hypothetical protein